MSGAIKNITLDVREYEEFTINGDSSRKIKLNTGDFGIIARLKDAVPMLNKLIEDYSNVGSNSDGETTDDELIMYADQFNLINDTAKEIVNTIFGTDVCSACLKGGTMMDLNNGEFNFEIIISTLLSLYKETIQAETDKLQKKIKKHTAKYTPKDHLKKK